MIFAALVPGVAARPPDNLTRGIEMLLPGAFLLAVALKGSRRSILPWNFSPWPPC